MHMQGLIKLCPTCMWPALQVYLASASPPVRYPSVYGVDMPTRKEFVAYNLTEPEICQVRS